MKVAVAGLLDTPGGVTFAIGLIFAQRSISRTRGQSRGDLNSSVIGVCSRGSNG